MRIYFDVVSAFADDNTAYLISFPIDGTEDERELLNHARRLFDSVIGKGKSFFHVFKLSHGFNR